MEEPNLFTSVPVSAEPIEIKKQKLEEFKKKYGVEEPVRASIDKEGVKWQHKKPDYTMANLAYLTGKSHNHKKGSLEETVENLVKTWEMEASHFADIEQWSCIESPNYTLQVNGGKVWKGHEAAKVGNYNFLLLDVKDKELYDSGKMTFHSSHAMFRTVFPEGFPWEVCEVFSGPPKVAFTWRHWARPKGQYKGKSVTCEQIEMYGFIIATVNDQLKIQALEIFYKPDEFLEVLEGKREAATLDRGCSLLGNGCPFFADKSQPAQTGAKVALAEPNKVEKKPEKKKGCLG